MRKYFLYLKEFTFNILRIYCIQCHKGFLIILSLGFLWLFIVLIVIYVWLNYLFQRTYVYGIHESFYKFAFIGLMLMVSIIFIFGTFLGASNLRDSGYDIKNEVTTAQPSTKTSEILYFLASFILGVSPRYVVTID